MLSDLFDIVLERVSNDKSLHFEGICTRHTQSVGCLCASTMVQHVHGRSAGTLHRHNT